MATITVTDAAYAAIRGAAENPLAKGSGRQTDDGWVIELADDTLARLDELRHEGESYSDAIIRAIATTTKGFN